MKLIHGGIPVLLLALSVGCASTREEPAEHESLMSKREQNALLAKARPLEEFNLSPSFPFGNGSLYLGSAVLEPGQSAVRRFEPGGMPVIELTGKSARRTMKVLLDTAANASWMQYSAAAKNDATFISNKGKVVPSIGVVSSKGVDAFAAVIPLLHIDGLTLNNTPLYVRMARGLMQPPMYSSSVPLVDAVLGYDNLRQFQYIQFDLAAGTVRFSTSTPYTPNDNLLIGQANLSSVCRDALAVQGSVFGQPVPIILDFAGDYAFARGDTRNPVTKQVELGEVVFVEVPTEVLARQDRYPRAGRKLLGKYLVTICPRRGLVYFERPTNP